MPNMYVYVKDSNSQVDIFGLNGGYLFRGTTEGYLGNPSLQRLGITPTSTDSRVSTIFGIEASNHGKGILQIATPSDLKGIDFEVPNVLSHIEKEVPLAVKPEDFTKLASIQIPINDAKEILKDMGYNLPPKITSKSMISETLKGLSNMSNKEIESFVERAKKYAIK